MIREAQLALSRAQSPRVRELAQRTVAEHTAAMQRQVAAHGYALQNLDRMMSHTGMPMEGASGGSMSHESMMHGPEDVMMMHRNNRELIASHLQVAQQMMGSVRSM